MHVPPTIHDLVVTGPRSRCARLGQALPMSSFQLTQVTIEFTINQTLESR
jgi:hypothetical protein